MTIEPADRDDGGSVRGNAARRPLAEIREESRKAPSPAREEIIVATLRASAELGYRRLTVAAVVERCGAHRLQFYRHFANVAECYVEAYLAHSEKLEQRLLEAGRAAGSWPAGLHAGLTELGQFAATDPLLASGLLTQVHVAGGPALERRKEVLERLSGALDSARRETRSRHSPPPLTAPLMVGAIEAAVVQALAIGEPQHFVDSVGELEQLISAAYF